MPGSSVGMVEKVHMEISLNRGKKQYIVHLTSIGLSLLRKAQARWVGRIAPLGPEAERNKRKALSGLWLCREWIWFLFSFPSFPVFSFAPVSSCGGKRGSEQILEFSVSHIRSTRHLHHRPQCIYFSSECAETQHHRC